LLQYLLAKNSLVPVHHNKIILQQFYQAYAYLRNRNQTSTIHVRRNHPVGRLDNILFLLIQSMYSFRGDSQVPTFFPSFSDQVGGVPIIPYPSSIFRRHEQELNTMLIEVTRQKDNNCQESALYLTQHKCLFPMLLQLLPGLVS